MIKKNIDLFFTETGKDTAVVFVGTFVNVVAGGLFFIFAPRILGPEDYGLFSTVIGTGILATSIANLGIDTGILRFVKKDSPESNNYLSIALQSYLVLGILIAFLGIFISPLIAEFLKQPQITNLLRVASITTIILLFTNLYVAGLQAKRHFVKAALVNISSNVARLIILAVGALFLKIGLIFITLLFFLIPIISVIMGNLFLPIRISKIEKEKVLNFHKYNFWIALSLIVTSIPFDNYLLLKYSGPLQAGIYAAPYKILTFVYQFSSNFTRVLASRFSSFNTVTKVRNFALKSSAFVLIFSLGLMVLILIASPLINIIFGNEFKNSIPIFRWLTLGFIFFFASTIPTSIILYYLGKSQITFSISFAKIILFTTLLLLLVGRYGAIGAAIAFSITELLTFFLMSSYVLYKLI